MPVRFTLSFVSMPFKHITTLNSMLSLEACKSLHIHTSILINVMG